MFSPKIGASLQKKPADMNRIISYMIYNLCGSGKVHWITVFCEFSENKKKTPESLQFRGFLIFLHLIFID